MAGIYTDIISITAPSSAVAGETVPVTVRVKNIHDYSFRISVAVTYDTSRFIGPEDEWVAAGATHSWLGSFTMPANDVTIWAYSSYWDGNFWRSDDEMSKDVDLEAVPIEWVELAVTSLSVDVTVIAEWVELAVTSLSVDIAVIVEWVELASVSLSVDITVEWFELAEARLTVAVSGVPPPPCVPGETKCIGPDLYECSLEGEWVLAEKDSPECVEEKEFPWLLVAGGLGAAALVVVATTKKKKPAKEKRA